jgi:hypothetical protein
MVFPHPLFPVYRSDLNEDQFFRATQGSHEDKVMVGETRANPAELMRWLLEKK